MARLFAEAFEGQRAKLIRMIDVNIDFLDRLRDAHIISQYVKDQILAGPTPYDKGSRLFDHLEHHCEDEYFEPFCVILTEMRKDVVAMMRENQKKLPGLDSLQIQSAAPATAIIDNGNEELSSDSFNDGKWSNGILKQAFRKLQPTVIRVLDVHDVIDYLYSEDVVESKIVQEMNGKLNDPTAGRELLTHLHGLNKTTTFRVLRKALWSDGNRRKYSSLICELEKCCSEVEKSLQVPPVNRSKLQKESAAQIRQVESAIDSTVAERTEPVKTAGSSSRANNNAAERGDARPTQDINSSGMKTSIAKDFNRDLKRFMQPQAQVPQAASPSAGQPTACGVPATGQAAAYVQPGTAAGYGQPLTAQTPVFQAAPPYTATIAPYHGQTIAQQTHPPAYTSQAGQPATVAYGQAPPHIQPVNACAIQPYGSPPAVVQPQQVVASPYGTPMSPGIPYGRSPVGYLPGAVISTPAVSIAVVLHVIAASEDNCSEVSGLTVLGDELFIVRSERPSKGRIVVYSATENTIKRSIKVKELEGDGKFLGGMTSCDSNNCLYVSYMISGVGGHIAKVKLNNNNKVMKWKVKDGYLPQGLSVNSEHNLIIAHSWQMQFPKLVEYTTRGDLVREILLQDDVVGPHHAIQLNNCQYLVCHGGIGDSLHRVCVVDKNGRVLLNYGNRPGTQAGQLNYPENLAIDKNGFIFVAHRSNNRIVVLDSSLNLSRDLQINFGTGVTKPHCLHLDKQRNVLFVGESNGYNSRVFVVAV